MDEQPIFTSQDPLIPLTREAESVLHSVKKWARFISIIGFIGIAFMLFDSIQMVLLSSGIKQGHEAPNSASALMGGFYLFLSLFLLIPVTYMFKFANTLDKALVNRSGVYFESAIKHLKNNFQFIGIMAILSILGIIAIVAYLVFATVSSPL